MEAQTLPYETFEEIYSRQLENDCYICLVYEINGEVIGCINLRMEYQLHHAGRICEIMELAVRYAPTAAAKASADVFSMLLTMRQKPKVASR